MGMTVLEVMDIRLAQGIINKELLVCSWKKIYNEVHETGNIRRPGGRCVSVCIMPQ